MTQSRNGGSNRKPFNGQEEVAHLFTVCPLLMRSAPVSHRRISASARLMRRSCGQCDALWGDGGMVGWPPRLTQESVVLFRS
jgi:hypothetical protein